MLRGLPADQQSTVLGPRMVISGRLCDPLIHPESLLLLLLLFFFHPYGNSILHSLRCPRLILSIRRYASSGDTALHATGLSIARNEGTPPTEPKRSSPVCVTTGESKKPESGNGPSLHKSVCRTQLRATTNSVHNTRGPGAAQ